jgi:glycosyltransferase involved in cell wall biosynthesis
LEGSNLHFYERKNYSDDQLLDLVSGINPSLIISSGWMDKGYVKVCKQYFGKIPTVMGLDNPWRSTPKQMVATVAGRLMLHTVFSHCWVPGESQRKYARMLGFSHQLISDGIYSCDFNSFHQQYLWYHSKKTSSLPKRILFVGRYTKLKGVHELWNAFVRFQHESPSEWELWCLGKGELENEFPVHPKIKNFGFVQPSGMSRFIEDCGVFILPSHYEHWGVVVHEFAAAGFPLICTHTTGAASVFLKDGENGYFVQPSSVDSLVEVFKKIAALSDEQLAQMGDKSALTASAITPETWAQTCMDFLN